MSFTMWKAQLPKSVKANLQKKLNRVFRNGATSGVVVGLSGFIINVTYFSHKIPCHAFIPIASTYS